MSYAVVVEMVKIYCAKCQTIFGFTEDFKNRRQEDHKEFYCPKGHINYWPQKSDKEKLELELSEAKEQYTRERIERQFHEKSARAFKGKITAIKNKIANGLCPCCGKHFKKLQRHMKVQHPDFREIA